MNQDDMVLTNQRHEILGYLKRARRHPTADQVYREVKKKLPRISKATVYNNLRHLVEKDLVEEVNVNGVARFEYRRNDHHHMVCTNCGRIDDIENEELSRLMNYIGSEIEGYEIERSATTFYGICRDCKNERGSQ